MTVMTAPVEVAKADTELNDLILSGSAMEAFERFYAEEVVMSDNDDEP